MGIDTDFAKAYAKAAIAAGQRLPESGTVFISMMDKYKDACGWVGGWALGMVLGMCVGVAGCGCGWVWLGWGFTPSLPCRLPLPPPGGSGPRCHFQYNAAPSSAPPLPAPWAGRLGGYSCRDISPVLPG